MTTKIWERVASIQARDTRETTEEDRLAKLTEELGELATFRNIGTGFKPMPSDLTEALIAKGKLKELADLHIVIMDYVQALGYTEEQFNEITNSKLDKWEGYATPTIDGSIPKAKVPAHKKTRVLSREFPAPCETVGEDKESK